MTTTIVVLSTIALLFIILKLVKPLAKKDPKNVLEVLESADYFKKTQELFELQKKAMAQGTDGDVMPEGIGEFGLEATNPIPTLTMFGNTAYLGKLRTINGTKVLYDRIGPLTVPNILHMIDAYKITADGGTTTIYLCAYNKKNSEKAPNGFRLASIEEAYFGSR